MLRWSPTSLRTLLSREKIPGVNVTDLVFDKMTQSDEAFIRSI